MAPDGGPPDGAAADGAPADGEAAGGESPSAMDPAAADAFVFFGWRKGSSCVPVRSLAAGGAMSLTALGALTSGSGAATQYFCSEKCRSQWRAH
jgi:hypothetical protein